MDDLALPVAVFLKTVVWPLLAAALVLLVAVSLGRLLRRDLAAQAVGLAFGASTAAVVTGVRGLPTWPLADTLDALAPLVALAALVGMATEPLAGRRWFKGLIGAAWSLLSAWVLLTPPGADPSALWLAAAIALGSLWASTSASRSAPVPGWLAAWAGAFAGSAGLLALSGSALLAQIQGAGAAVVGGLALLGFWRGLPRIPFGVVAPFVLAYGGILAYAWAFTEAPRGPLVLAFLAPAASVAGLWVRRPFHALLASGLLALALTGVAAGWASVSTPQPYAPY